MTPPLIVPEAMWRAEEILAALTARFDTAALVPEVVIWTDPEDPKSSRRIDALMFQRLERTAIEVKVTPQDFARDTYIKRKPWMAVCHRFYYAVPDTLAPLVTAPEGTGLLVVSRTPSKSRLGRRIPWTVQVRTKATVTRVPSPLPQVVVQALAYRAARVSQGLEPTVRKR